MTATEPLRISKGAFDVYVADQLARFPYGQVAYDMLMFGSPRLIDNREYIVELPAEAPPEPSETS